MSLLSPRIPETGAGSSGPASPPARPRGASPPDRSLGASTGFTLVEAMVALAITIAVTACFLLLFRHGGGALRLEPELAAIRQDARGALDRIARDLVRAGSGLPPEIPVFADLGPAGDGGGRPDGLDFLAAPARLGEVVFEPVAEFDGTRVTLGVPGTGLDPRTRPLAAVFNDDKFMPRWVVGEVVSVRSEGSGALSDLLRKGREKAGDEPASGGASVQLRALPGDWHRRFHAGDGGTFSPGQGGLIGRSLQALLGGFVESALPGVPPVMKSAVTEKLTSAVVDIIRARKGKKAKGKKSGKTTGGGAPGSSLPGDDEDLDDGSGLFGLGQPGLVPVARIRYRVGEPDEDGQRLLLRQVDDEAPQPVAFVEDFQVRYFTGDDAASGSDDPPGYVGDMSGAGALSRHVVRAVEVTVRMRSTVGRYAANPGDEAGKGRLSRSFTRRVGLRVAAAGADRRLWEEAMQQKAVLAEVPRVGPLRFLGPILDVLR